MRTVDGQEGRTGKQALLRETNDRVLGLSEGHAVDVAEFLCECGERGCAVPVPISLRDYAEIRRDPTLNILATDHSSGPHELVFAGPEYMVVRTCDGAPGAAGEVPSRLIAIREALEHEGQALVRHHDERLLDVLVEIDELKLSIAKALGWLRPDRPLDS